MADITKPVELEDFEAKFVDMETYLQDKGEYCETLKTVNDIFAAQRERMERNEQQTDILIDNVSKVIALFGRLDARVERAEKQIVLLAVAVVSEWVALIALLWAVLAQ